jgi:MFS family permease
MNIHPLEKITSTQLNSGLKLVIADGMAAEAMVVFTSGTFLTAMAIYMGASNFKLGLLAALPTFTTIFQLLSVWLVQKFNNRKIVTSVFNLLARMPLIAIGIMPFLFSAGTSIQVLLVLLFFQHIFGDIAGASWNSWMKDLVPGDKLGRFFSRRTRMSQTLNVSLSLAVAMAIDYIKVHYPAHEISAYTILFLVGGVLGMLSVFLLLRTPEPKPDRMHDNVFKMLGASVRNINFRNLLAFHSLWAFGLNLATPFFTVYMMKTIGLPLSYVIILTVIGQLSSIASLRLWGKYSDRFSNKTIINICAPFYIACIFAFAFTAIPTSETVTLTMLLFIHIISGVSAAGINLAINNISIKLAPKGESIVYISAKNMFTAFFSTIAPILGGFSADFLADHALKWNIQFDGSHGPAEVTFINLQGWNYFFIFGGLIAIINSHSFFETFVKN